MSRRCTRLVTNFPIEFIYFYLSVPDSRPRGHAVRNMYDRGAKQGRRKTALSMFTARTRISRNDVDVGSVVVWREMWINQIVGTSFSTREGSFRHFREIAPRTAEYYYYFFVVVSSPRPGGHSTHSGSFHFTYQLSLIRHSTPYPPTPLPTGRIRLTSVKFNRYYYVCAFIITYTSERAGRRARKCMCLCVYEHFFFNNNKRRSCYQ